MRPVKNMLIKNIPKEKRSGAIPKKKESQKLLRFFLPNAIPPQSP